MRHIHSRWDPNTRQVFSEEEAELEELLADDDEMNKSDEPSLKRNSSSPEINIPTGAFLSEDPVIYQDDNSDMLSEPNIPSRLLLKSYPQLKLLLLPWPTYI